MVLHWTTRHFIFVAITLAFAGSAIAQNTANVRAQLVAVQQQIKQAQQLYVANKYEEAGALISQAETALGSVPNVRDKATRGAKEKLTATVTAAKTMLEKRGVIFAPNSDAMPATASGAGGVSFIKEIAPLLQDKCFHCHGGDETRARLRLVTFEGILRGGNNGAAVRPGNRGSLLLRRIKGEGDDEQMPPDGDPFTAAEIALIEKWVIAGAPFDGGDPSENIPNLITQFEVAKLSHEALWEQRAQFVQKNWDLGMPGVTSATVKTKNLRIMGTSAVAEIEKIGKATEARLDAVADLLAIESDKPLLKGGATIYIVTRRYDYSEFGQMVEQRTLPRGSHGHWRYNGRDAYGVVLYGNSDSFAKDALVAEQVAGLALASRGLPTWFAEGAGLAVAARLEPKDPRLLALRAQAKESIRAGAPAKKFLEGDLSPDASRLVGLAFVERLMASKKSWGQLMSAIAQGKPFNTAFSTAYRATPEQLLAGLRAK